MSNDKASSEDHGNRSQTAFTGLISIHCMAGKKLLGFQLTRNKYHRGNGHLKLTHITTHHYPK